MPHSPDPSSGLSKRIALAMGWMMRSSDKVSARYRKSKNVISINSWVRTYPNREIKRRKTNCSWAQVILSPPDFSSLVDTTFQLNSNTSRLSIERQCKVRLHHPRKIISGDDLIICHSCQAKALAMCLSLLIPGVTRKKKTTTVVWRSRKTSTGDWSLSVEDDLDSCEERKGTRSCEKQGMYRMPACPLDTNIIPTYAMTLFLPWRFSWSWSNLGFYLICCSRRNSTSTRNW